MAYTLQDDEIALIIKPTSQDGTVVGISTGMVMGKNIYTLGTVGGMCIDTALTMAAAVQAVEEDADLSEYLEDYKVAIVKDMFPEEYESVLKEHALEDVDETNVVRLNKWTQTKGNA